MPKIPTVTELLAQQPDEELHKMREANKQELSRAQDAVSRLRVEGFQIEQALKRRRDARSGGRLTRDEVHALASLIRAPFTVKGIQEGLEMEYERKATANTVRNHLNRLVDDGKLIRNGEGGYSVKIPHPSLADFGGAAAADDDIPF